MADKRKVLITGAAGHIGTFLRNAWKDEYSLVLMDVSEIIDPGDAQFYTGDIQDVEMMRKACEGVDTVIHLAANPSPWAEFDSQVLPQNIIGTHNVFSAAAEMGVKRVIYASSIHAVGAYPPDVQVRVDMPVRPCCEYGASKCYGEALGHYFTDKKGLSVLVVRIGGVRTHDTSSRRYEHELRRFDTLISEEDLTQLITKAVEAPDNIRFEIFHAVSDNRFKRLDISRTREVLGYEPEDKAGEELEIPEQLPVHPERRRRMQPDIA